MDQKEVLRVIEKAAREGTPYLDLSKHKLTALPPEIGRLTNLTRFDLRNNQLTALPPEIGRLTNLTRLFLGDNQLTAVPPEIARLTNLTALSLWDNRLTALPPEIGRLTNLTALRLGGNQLTAFPPETGSLTNLTELTLGGNQLTALPPEIGSLTNLTELRLGGNQLSALPPEIGSLTNLTELTLGGNQLTALPPEIGRLTKLENLDLRGNQLISPPSEIVKQRMKAILAYLQDRLREGEKQGVSKLLLVGEAGTGKTSLLKVLRGKAVDHQESKTRGIEIHPVALRHPTEADVTMQLNAWDFGGQEIYHATHQFFLTNRSLFLLLWNARLGFEQGKLYYWLDTIQAKAPESPVIVVSTFIDEHQASLPLADLRRKYPQIIAHCEISNTTKVGMEELRREIASAAARLPLMGETWPANWLEAANEIRGNPANHVKPAELNSVMSRHSVTAEKGPVLARWLHELGDILYFQDDPELNDTVILKPQWVTQSLSSVLESEKVKKRSGVFTRDDEQELWASIEPGMRDHFLRLMEKYDLSYRTLADPDKSLVVELLPFDPAQYEERWDGIRETGSCKEIQMRFLLKTTMPAGVPTWFIARSHRFTTNTHWRYGALFSDKRKPEHLGLIQAFPHDRYLTLTVRGPAPHNFFALLRDGLELTLDRFPGLKIDQKIPCPGHNGESCSHEFDLANLQKAMEMSPPVLEIQCPVAFENISVPGLVFGIHWREADSARLDELLRKMDAILEQNKALRDGVEEVKGESQALLELSQREFTKIHRREQARMESYCPSVFVLRPHESNSWLTDIAGQKMWLQLFCEAPGCWHPAGEDGCYLVKEPAEWLQRFGPYVRGVVLVLKYAAPLVGPWLGHLRPQEYEKLLKNDLRLMEELVKKLPDIKASPEEGGLKELEPYGQGDRAMGAGLRALNVFLEEKDKQHRWGGLRKISTPEGHFLWICEHHAKEYAR